MPSASSSHRTSPEMRRSRSDNAFCADGGGDDNGLTQVDALLPTVTKPTIGGGAIGKGGTDGVYVKGGADGGYVIRKGHQESEHLHSLALLR